MFNSRSASRILFLLALLAMASLLAAGCGSSSDSDKSDKKDDAAAPSTSTSKGDDAASGDLPSKVEDRNDFYDAPPSFELDAGTTYVVKLKTDKGDFDITLDPKAGPIAAANFAFLVKEGYYDGIVFHRIIKDFMIQTGDPTGTGTGGPGYSLKDDKITGNYDRGVVAMANAGPNTGGSQFFIVHGTEVNNQLGKDYVIFGKIDTAGMKVVDKIADVKVKPSASGEPSQPVDPVAIKTAELVES